MLMPFFGGSKPQDGHTIRFYSLLVVVTLAGALSFFKRIIVAKEKIKSDISNPLIFALIVYWLVSAASLFTVNPNQVVLSIFQFNSDLIRHFLNLDESSGIYSYLSFFVLTVSYLFGLLIIYLASEPKRALFLVRCFLLGMIVTIILGIADYYNFINLNSIRPWYFIGYGENYRFARLTSVFGNPGWYAQYLVLGAPALLAIIALNWRKTFKLVTLIGLMILTEFCIILIYQRGGWLSYPLTLVIIWFCVYILDSDSVNLSSSLKAFRGSFTKIAISLPLTIAISISLVYFTGRSQTENRQQISGFVERVESITNANDRFKYWEPAVLMASLHPLFGSGMESFASQYDKLYVAPGHKYKQTPKYDVYPYYGSAHNLYFQAVAGKGFLGLLSIFGVFLAVFSLAWKGVLSPSPTAPILNQPQRLLLMMALAYTCALAIYGNVGEIFYSPIGYIPFVFFYAVCIATVPPAYCLSSRFRAWVLGFLAIAFAAHLYLEFGGRFAR